ncbi:MAG: TonB-dependent receptor [Prolixibacteraceae bacterium]|nr:TonB-dependent receptor [Prolixibacteraceae bacterium]
MKKIFMVCVMVLSGFIINAQNILSGKVTGQDNLPIAGATVILPDLNKGAVSNENGQFKLTNLPNGKTTVRISFIGYKPEIKTVFLTGEKKEVDVMLQESVLETEEIVVSGGYRSTQHGNAVKIDVLKLLPTEIKATPNFTEVLTKVPGVDMISKGSGVSKPVIRGLSMNDILVLNNSVRFENYQYSSHHPLGIDEFGIDNVEIIKGPASLLYGSDAIGGVINFIREKPATQRHIEGDYNLQLFSNTLGMTNNLGIKGASEKFFGGIRAGHKTNADFLQGGGEYAANTRFNEYSVKTNIGHTGKTGMFQLFYDYSQQNLGLAEEEAVEAIPERGRNCRLFYQQLNTHLLSSQNKIYFNRMKLDVNVAFQETGLAHFGEAGEYELEMKLATTTYEARLYLPSDAKSEYILGVQGMNQVNTNVNNRETILLPGATMNNYSLFGLLQRTFFDKLKFQTGLRYDYRTLASEAVGLSGSGTFRPALEKNYESFSGSAGTTYYFSEDLLLRANIATAYRTPNLAELSSNGPHEARYEIGDQSLVPERSYEADLGMHYHIDNLTIDLACFFNRVNHFIYISPTETETSKGLPIYRYMQNDSRLYGGEAGIHFHPKSLEWLHVEGTFSRVTGKQDNGKYLPFIPAHKVNFEMRAEKDRLLFVRDAFVSASSHTALDQNHAAPDEVPTNGYTLFNLGAGGKLSISGQTIFFGLNATNLFDRKYTDHLSTLKEVNYYNPGRNISLSLKFYFKQKNQ